MSLDKAIEYGKEHRKRYYDSRDTDKTCRSHGSCPWCRRKIKYKKKKQKMKGEYDDGLNEE